MLRRRRSIEVSGHAESKAWLSYGRPFDIDLSMLRIVKKLLG
jgi:hypothetical protein